MYFNPYTHEIKQHLTSFSPPYLASFSSRNDQGSTRVNSAISVDPSNVIDKYFASEPHRHNVNIDILLSGLTVDNFI